MGEPFFCPKKKLRLECQIIIKNRKKCKIYRNNIGGKEYSSIREGTI